MLERMRTLALFAGWNEADLARLAGRMAEQELAAGEVLFRQGEPGRRCYLVLEGELEAVANQGAFEQRLELCPPGRIIGEMALLDASPRSATVRAIQPSRVAALDEPALIELMQGNPALTLDMLRSSTMRLRRTSQHLIDDLAAKHAELLRAYQELEAAQAERIRLGRLDEELAVARRIHAHFLPAQLPQPPGWQLAAYNRGAHAIGGDFYDCIELDDGTLGLVIADVCGKGVPAALFVALARSLLRATMLALAAFRQPGLQTPASRLIRALELTNQYIAREHGQSHMFITIFAAVLAPATGLLHYVNSGHNAPLLIGADGVLRGELASATLPLGIDAGQRHTAGLATLAPGETLLCYTDGISEAMSPDGDLLGEEELIALALAHSRQPPHELVARLIAAADAHAAGAPQSDDMTVLVVRREQIELL